MPGLKVVIVYNKEDKYIHDLSITVSNLISRLAKGSTLKYFDVRQPPQPCDLCIHMCEPYAVWFSWARASCMIVDTWKEAWDGYKDSFFKINKADMNEEAIIGLINDVKDVIDAQSPAQLVLPPLLKVEDCPPISVITLVYNRPKFIENACLNLLSTDYPKDKIEWVVIDDSDADKSPSDRIIKFQDQFPGTIVYIPLTKKTALGVKRNLAIERAKNDILLMMDDDDHYPETSFRRRVAYLTKGRLQVGCAVCTSIAMYDLRTGVSAVNVPPFDLSLGQRCSEATLTFTRRFWEGKKFGSVDMAEGEAFLEGREAFVAEMPPQQIIVALSHGTNTSRRKTPDGDPGCFWGFPRELIEFLHGLVGVKVEAI
jgi:hypothetical protein